MGTPIRLSVAAIATVLAACATSYKPESVFNQGGFSEQRRSPGVYQVWFVGNEYTTEDRSEELAMLRAAELCLGESKPYMHTSDFQSGSSLVGVTQPRAIMKSVPVVPTDPTKANPPSPVPRTVGYMPGRALYNTRSGLKVECLDERGEDSQEAAVLAATLRERYGIKAESRRQTPSR